MNRISACIITLNEERNLRRSLDSLRAVVDEVVVVDSGSTDRTEDIAREFGAIRVSQVDTIRGTEKLRRDLGQRRLDLVGGRG